MKFMSNWWNATMAWLCGGWLKAGSLRTEVAGRLPGWLTSSLVTHVRMSGQVEYVYEWANMTSVVTAHGTRMPSPKRQHGIAIILFSPPEVVTLMQTEATLWSRCVVRHCLSCVLVPNIKYTTLTIHHIHMNTLHPSTGKAECWSPRVVLQTAHQPSCASLCLNWSFPNDL